MTPFRIIVLLVAVVCLALFDHLIVAASFLGAPGWGGGVLATGLAGMIAGAVLRRRRLVFAAQNVVMILSIAHAVRGETGVDMASGLYFTGVILLGNLFVWPIARSIARPAGAI